MSVLTRRRTALAAVAVAVAAMCAVAAPAQATSAPQVTKLSHHDGPTVGGQRLAVRGTHFSGVRAVTFGGVAGTEVHVMSGSLLWVTTPKHAAGTVHVQVRTAAGRSGATTTAAKYSYGVLPMVNYLSDYTSPTAGGRTVTVYASYARPFSVMFGTVRAKVVRTSGSNIVVTAPPHAAGLVHVIVHDNYGQSLQRLGSAFRYGRANTTRWAPVEHFDPQQGGLRSIACLTGGFCAAVDDSGAAYVRTSTAAAWTKSHQFALLFDRVFCATTTFCVASESADGYESHFDGEKWSTPTLPSTDPPAEAPTPFLAVSCVSDTSCHAVDDGGYFYTWNGNTWSGVTTPIPNPIGITCASATDCVIVAGTGNPWRLTNGSWVAGPRIGHTSLDTLACASGTSCVVTDIARHSYRYDGSTWTAIGDLPPRTSGEPEHVSCGVDGYCVDLLDAKHATALQGDTWSAPFTVDSAGEATDVACAAPKTCSVIDYGGAVTDVVAGTASPAVPVDRLQGRVVSVSCTTAVDCVAIDFNGNAFVRTASGWGTPTRLAPRLNLVSCASPTYCMVVGGTQAYAYDGTRWTALGTADPNGLFGLSCSATKHCVGVDNHGRAATYDGTSWTYTTVNPGGFLFKVSCSSPRACLAIDSGHVAFRFSGGHWTRQGTAFTGLGFNNVWAVSCPTDTQCFVTTDDGAVLHLSGTTWTRTAKVGNSASAISCASATSCLTYGDGSEQFDGKSWSVVAPLPASPADLDRSADDTISCGSPTSCTAVLTTGVIRIA